MCAHIISYQSHACTVTRMVTCDYLTIVASICTSFLLLCGKPDKDAKYSGGNINNTSHASV